MSRLSMLAALLLAFGLAGHASASAWAESKPSNPAAVPKITESQARSIAFRHGLVHVEEIALSDSRWEIAGRAQGGVEVTLDLNAYDGSVIGGAAAPDLSRENVADAGPPARFRAASAEISRDGLLLSFPPRSQCLYSACRPQGRLWR